MPKRLIITGESGRGKTTLARRLSLILGIPAYSTDEFYFRKRFSIVRDPDEALDMLLATAGSCCWIIEGTTKRLIGPALGKADLVVYLEHRSFALQCYLIIRRSFRRDYESMTDTVKLLWYLFTKRYRLFSQKGVEPTKDFVFRHRSDAVVLRSFKEIEQFLSEIAEKR